jgi:hypothetical protein
MADPKVLIITDATVALGPAPATGQPIVAASLIDFKCQITRAEITSTGNASTTDRAATYCAPASETQVPKASSFALALEGFQDWTDAAGVSAWLFQNDATTRAFALFLDKQTNPSATGLVVVQAGNFAGLPQEPLTFTVELPIQGYPDIKGPTGASLRPTGVKSAAAPGATFPTEATITASDTTNAAKLAGLGYVAAPQTAWTLGQKITILPSYDFNWSGTAWAAGAHATTEGADDEDAADETDADAEQQSGRGRGRKTADA